MEEPAVLKSWRNPKELATKNIVYMLHEKAERKSPTLTQLVSLQSPVMLVATQVKADPDGHYGFSAHWVEGQGLTVVHTEGANLRLNDRLVEVNGASVLGSSEDELELLLKTNTAHIAHIIVLRQLAQELRQEDPSSPHFRQTSALRDHQDIQVLQKHQTI